MWNRIRTWIEEDLWATDLREVSGWRWFGLWLARIVVHLAYSFSRSLGGLRASGLTLVTLLALVPTLVLVLSIARAFGADYGSMVRNAVAGLAGQLPEGVREAADYIQALVDSTSFGALGTMGTLVLVWSAFALFSKIQLAFNAVWRASRRSWLRRITDFVAVVVLVPPLVIAAFVLQGVLATGEAAQTLRQYAWLAWLLDAGLGFVPFVVLWIALAAVYKLMPSARVHWIPAMVAAVAAGSGMLVLHGLYLQFQIGVAHNNAIYATIAALPLLLVYLQLVWTVILVGAELSYAVQHVYNLRGPTEQPAMGTAIRKRLAWHLVERSGRGFRDGERGCNLGEVAAELDVPREWVVEVAEGLAQGGVLSRIAGDEDLYAPARPPERISVADAWAAAEPEGDAMSLDRVAVPAEAEARFAAAEQAAQKVLREASF